MSMERAAETSCPQRAKVIHPFNNSTPKGMGLLHSWLPVRPSNDLAIGDPETYSVLNLCILTSPSHNLAAPGTGLQISAVVGPPAQSELRSDSQSSRIF